MDPLNLSEAPLVAKASTPTLRRREARRAASFPRPRSVRRVTRLSPVPCAHVLGMGVQGNLSVSHKPKPQTGPGGQLGRAGPAGPRANVVESFAQRDGGRRPRGHPAPRLLEEQTLLSRRRWCRFPQ